MRKKLLALVCAAVLALALPTLAWAAPSPGGSTSVDAGNGVSANVTFSGTVEITATQQQASNVQLSSTEKVLASVEIQAEGVSESNPLTLSFSVGSQYAGATAKIFVQHNDGTTEVLSAVVAADGTVSVPVTKLSIFTLVVDTATIPASDAGTTTDTTGTTAGTSATTSSTTSGSSSNAVSPKTGVDMTLVAAGTAVLAVCAGGVAVALRKKVTE